MQDCKSLALRILDALSYGLKLEEKNYLSSLHKSILGPHNHSSLRYLYYPPISGKLKKGQIRLLEHTDYGCMTLLFQDSVGGLQIKSRDGTYIDACPIENSVLINVADLLQYWTHGDLKSTPHRILVPDDPLKRSAQRQSIAFFVHPNENLFVSNTLFKRDVSDTMTLRNFTKQQLENMTVGEYVTGQFSRTYA
uniref:Fe2OG dioxygenase domain-containing protein n=1 Tax=Ciona savignyi TaxID=51511 RepID=H2YS76_CIOSA